MPAIPTRDDVLAVLHGVVDPELGSNVVDLGMVQDIQIDEGGRVRVWVTLTISGCPLRTQIQSDGFGLLSGQAGMTIGSCWADRASAKVRRTLLWLRPSNPTVPE